MKKIQKQIRAFTLIELLVVIVIIGILATIGIGTFSGYKEKAEMAKLAAVASQTKKAILASNIGGEVTNTAYYTFDDSDISTTSPYVLDRSGSGNDIVGGDSATFSASDDSPLAGKSLRTTNSYMGITAGVKNPPIDEFTVSFLFKNKGGASATPYIFWTGNGTRIMIDEASSRLGFWVDEGGGSPGKKLYSPNGSVGLGTWHHLIASYEGAVGSGAYTMNLWLDGKKVATQTGTDPNPGDLTSLYFTFSGTPFDGWLDELIYSPVSVKSDFLD